MSTFLQHKTLIGGALALGLLGAMQMPAAFAGTGQAEHEHSSATSHEPASKPPAPSQGQQMKHGDMDHGAMGHSDMGHDTMSGEHNANEAEAGSNHDH